MLAKTLLGDALQDYRRTHSLTAPTMARALGLTTAGLAAVEDGRTPDTRDLERLINDAYPDFLTT
jgi:DNA-binding XRE family transcriptional regulator